MEPCVQMRRSESTVDLFRYPYAFTLLAMISYRAQRTQISKIKGLKIGEALIGDHRSCGMTRGQYREALEKLIFWNFVTTRTTNRGTIVKLINTDVFNPNFDDSNQQSNQPTTITATSQQPANNQPTTTIKNERRKEEKTLAENPAPAPKDDKPKEKPKKKTTFPQDFALTDKLREYAKAQGYHNDLDRLFEDFRIHHCSKGTVHLDWGLALMKWIRNEVSWGKGGAQPIPPSKPGEPGNVFANVPEYAHLKYADDDPAFHEWRERERQANERAAENA